MGTGFQIKFGMTGVFGLRLGLNIENDEMNAISEIILSDPATAGELIFLKQSE